MDLELNQQHRVWLGTTSLADVQGEPVVMETGMIVVCRGGCAVAKVNFGSWKLEPGAVMTVFPGDVMMVSEASADFVVEALIYDSALLREASLQIEHTVYSRLRADCCRVDRPDVTAIADAIFSLLRIYFAREHCSCLAQMVLLQLKAFFLGYDDYLRHSPGKSHNEKGTRRQNELFNRFMENVEMHFREFRDVNSHAAMLNVSAKYLNSIVRLITGHSAKTIINHYAVLQIKLELQRSDSSLKQIAWDYHFCDLSFFCRFFKQNVGVTPQQFRKSRRQR